MNITDGLIGALITALVMLFIRFYDRMKKRGKAHKVLRQLKRHLERTKGDYCQTKTTNDNREVAHNLYIRTDKEIIATAFSENPALYGTGDFAQHFQSRDFIRITSSDICDVNSQRIASSNLESVHPGGKFIVVPSGVNFMRIDGMFCRFEDDTYLAFLSFRNPKNASRNSGLILIDNMAERFYDYYRTLADEFRETP